MKTKFFLIMAIMCVSTSAMSVTPTAPVTPAEPDKKMLSIALQKHLSQQGDLCLGKFDWPIDVSQHDIDMGARDALQMPVLEKLGLVSSTTGSVMRKENGDVEASVAVKRYALTEAGKKFYITREMISGASTGKKTVHQGDFCAAKLSLNKLVKWDAPVITEGHQELTATYTYKVAAADWSRDPEIAAVFPMIDRIIKGEKQMELKQRMRLTNNSWEAVNPWE